ncbi:hypothetical protein AGLY_007803 [Aphis glycines]|uniref:Uncharacterized protein n=1 Tax=Aphis glycines TaxID=307491 RepID=A0A6G0TN26_APHGL|nr:hypothetical protein AGLY_007803 [Aphis glycines]
MYISHDLNMCAMINAKPVMFSFIVNIFRHMCLFNRFHFNTPPSSYSHHTSTVPLFRFVINENSVSCIFTEQSNSLIKPVMLITNYNNIRFKNAMATTIYYVNTNIQIDIIEFTRKYHNIWYIVFNMLLNGVSHVHIIYNGFDLLLRNSEPTGLQIIKFITNFIPSFFPAAIVYKIHIIHPTITDILLVNTSYDGLQPNGWKYAT